MEDGGQRRAGVFRIEIDLSRHERLMSQQGPAKIQFPLHLPAQTPFEMLGGDFPQEHLLDKIFRADGDGGLVLGTSGETKDEDQPRQSFCSTHSNPRSATTAMRAAGTAPANSDSESTAANPRKIRLPVPPRRWQRDIKALRRRQRNEAGSPDCIRAQMAGRTTEGRPLKETP